MCMKSKYLVSCALLSIISTHVSCTSNVTSFIKDTARAYHIKRVLFMVPNSTSVETIDFGALNVPIVFFTKRTGKDLKRHHHKNSLFIVQKHQQYLLSSDVVRSMTRGGRTIILDSDESEPTEVNMKPIFEWLWSKRVVKAVLLKIHANESIDAFTYNPFPEIKVFKVPDQEHPFDDKPLNMMGYRIRSYALSDAPRVFKFCNRQGEEVITGFAARTFFAFLQKHNGTFVDVGANSTYLHGTMLGEMLLDDEIDIGMHPYTIVFPSLTASIPITMLRMVVTLPAAEEIEPSLYNVLPFDTFVWYLVFGFTVCFCGIDFLVSLLLGKKVNFGEVLIGGSGIMIGIPPNMKVYSKVWQGRLIYVFCALLSIIVTSLYQSTLVSFYTTRVYGKQMRTKEDIIENNFTVLAIDNEWLLLQFIVVPYEFRRQFQTVPLDEFTRTRLSFNRSFGYLTADDKIDFNLKRQTIFSRPPFINSQLSVLSANIHFLMPPLTPFEVPLSRVVRQCQEAGLVAKWFDDAFYDGIEGHLWHLFEFDDFLQNKFKPLVLSNFEYYWIFWMCGLLLASLSFLAEVLIAYLKKFYHRCDPVAWK